MGVSDWLPECCMVPLTLRRNPQPGVSGKEVCWRCWGLFWENGGGKIRIPLQVWSPWVEKPDSIHKDAQKSLSKTRVITQIIKESSLTKLFIIKPLEKVGYLVFPPLSIFISSEDYRQENKLYVKGGFSSEKHTG